MKTCAICRVNKTDRLIKGIPVCGECYVEGQYNLPENQELLRERLRERSQALRAAKAAKAAKASKPKTAKQPQTKQADSQPK